MKIKKLFGFVVILALILTAVPAAAGIPAPVTVQILAVNDFHGALDPSLTKPTDPASGKPDNPNLWYYNGGAEYLANFVFRVWKGVRRVKAQAQQRGLIPRRVRPVEEPVRFAINKASFRLPGPVMRAGVLVR